MKILLIQPTISKADVYGRVLVASNNVAPLGLASLASVVRHEHDVKILDGWVSHITPQVIEREIRKYSPDIVGVSSTTSSHPAALEVFYLVKRLNPNITTLYGGVHATACKEKSMHECKDIDFVIIGEGERTIVELISALEGKMPMNNVKGILYRSGKDDVKATPPREAIDNLDSIPFPAYDLLQPLERYSMIRLRVEGTGPTMTVITSRGCPYNCGYCDKTLFGRSWRAHSAEYVVKNLIHLYETFGIRRFAFEDDNIAIDRKRLEDICNGIIDAGLDIRFSMMIRIEAIDDELLVLLRKAGCSSLFFGLESSKQSTLQTIEKAADLQAIKDTIKRIRRHGIKSFGGFIYGLPMESKEDMRKTLDFALKSGLDGASFHLFTPYPQTEMREMAHKCGEVNKDLQYYSGHSSVPSFIPKGWTATELLGFQRESYLKYYLRPRWFINNLDVLKYPDFAWKALSNFTSLTNPFWKANE